MDVTVLQDGGMCIAGPGAVVLHNAASEQWRGGLWTLTFANQSKSVTIGEFFVNCPTTYPGGVAACQSSQRLQFACQPIYLSVRPPPFR
jgi:hypothetical protein